MASNNCLLNYLDVYIHVYLLLPIIIVLMVLVFHSLLYVTFCKKDATWFIWRDSYGYTILVLLVILPICFNILYVCLSMLCSETQMIYVIIRMYVIQTISFMYLMYIFVYNIYSYRNNCRNIAYSINAIRVATRAAILLGIILILPIFIYCIFNMTSIFPWIIKTIFNTNITSIIFLFFWRIQPVDILITSLTFTVILLVLLTLMLIIRGGAPRYKIEQLSQFTYNMLVFAIIVVVIVLVLLAIIIN